jgi:hypothetical protein
MNRKQILAEARIRDRFIEIFILLIEPNERDFAEVADLMADLTPQDLRTLRAASTRLDAALDALALDRHLKRD